MTSTFPSAPDNIRTDVTNGTAEADTHPDLHNQLASAVNAIEVSLLGQVYNVKAFGAAGDGIADDTADIQAAINAASADGGGIVFLPQGIYQVTSELTISSTVGIVGVGSDAATDPAGPTPASNAASALRWAGPTALTTAVVHVEKPGGVCGGMSFRDFVIDGGCTAPATGAGYGLRFAGVQQTLVENVEIMRCGTNCLRLEGNSSTNTSFNTFIRVRLVFCDQPLYLHGTLTAANTCHNTFVGLQIEHGLAGGSTSPGIYLGDCDNNTFFGAFIYRRAGTGYGVEFANVGHHGENVFVHLQSGQGGLVARAGVLGAKVFQYSRDNGQPLPTIEAGAQLSYTSDGYSGAGWRVDNTLAPRVLDAPLLQPTGNVTEQRNGTTAQSALVYNTYDTAGANYERLSVGWAGNTAVLSTQQAGSGVARTIMLRGPTVVFSIQGTNAWQVDASGHFTSPSDNVFDIGRPGGFRPRNLFVAGAVKSFVKAGAPVDADFTQPTDGMYAVDTTNNRAYFRVGGVWKYAALT